MKTKRTRRTTEADRKMRVDRPGLEPGTAECKGPDGHQVAALNKRYVGRRSQLASKHAAAGVFFVSWAPDAPSAFPHNGSCRYCGNRAGTRMLDVDSMSVASFCYRCVHDALASGWRRLEGGAL